MKYRREIQWYYELHTSRCNIFDRSWKARTYTARWTPIFDEQHSDRYTRSTLHRHWTSAMLQCRWTSRCSWKMRRQLEAGATVYRKSLAAPADVIFTARYPTILSPFMHELARKKSSRSYGIGGDGDEETGWAESHRDNEDIGRPSRDRRKAERRFTTLCSVDAGCPSVGLFFSRWIIHPDKWDGSARPVVARRSARFSNPLFVTYQFEYYIE